MTPKELMASWNRKATKQELIEAEAAGKAFHGSGITPWAPCMDVEFMKMPRCTEEMLAWYKGLNQEISKSFEEFSL